MMHDWFQHTQSLVTNSNNNSSNDICRTADRNHIVPERVFTSPRSIPATALSRQRVRKSACSCFLQAVHVEWHTKRESWANYSNWFINIAVTIYYKYFRRFLGSRYWCNSYQFERALICRGCEFLVEEIWGRRSLNQEWNCTEKSVYAVLDTLRKVSFNTS